MNPQGSQIINTDAIDTLIERIRSARNPADLSTYTDQALSPLSAKLDIVQQQMAALAPYLAVMSAPTPTPTAIVSWITDLITASITPQVTAYTSYAQQIATLSGKLAELRSAIQLAAARFDDFELDLPEMPVITVPQVPELPGGLTP